MQTIHTQNHTKSSAAEFVWATEEKGKGFIDNRCNIVIVAHRLTFEAKQSFCEPFDDVACATLNELDHMMKEYRYPGDHAPFISLAQKQKQQK